MKHSSISRWKWARLSVIVLTSFGIGSTLAYAERAGDQSEVNAAALYSSRCLLCHGPGGRGPQLSAMAQLKRDTIYSILAVGIMKKQAAGLSAEQQHALADYIGRKGSPQGAISLSPACTNRSSNTGLGGEWIGWSPDFVNSRYQPSPGLSPSDVPALKLKWAFVFPDSASASNQVTVARGRMFVGSWDGIIYALDPSTGCSYWTFKTDSGVRSAVTVVGQTAYFGDFLANVYALDTDTGKLQWRTKVDDHPYARVTGSLVVNGELVYVPVASLEEGVAGDPQYTCCTFRGSVVALNRNSGSLAWKGYTIDQTAKPTGKNKAGIATLGPAGVSIWSTPTVDAKRGALYVATGNNYSGPDVPATDAIIAFDLKTGVKRWVRSQRPSDQWNASCLGDKSNCPDSEGPDFDFGASPILVQLSNGRSLVLAGQKSGMFYALDPDKNGELVWESRLGQGGSLGGIEWGFAADGTRAYVAISDWDIGDPSKANGSLTAVDLTTGKELWRRPNPTDTCAGRQPVCSSADAAAVTVIPGVVLAGSLDGYLRAYDAPTGKILWQYDTNQDVTGVNGVAGHGGSVNGAGATVSGGLVFQTTGYAAYGLGIPGNALLVFGVPGKDGSAVTPSTRN